jgi:hypothetical protein
MALGRMLTLESSEQRHRSGPSLVAEVSRSAEILRLPSYLPLRMMGSSTCRARRLCRGKSCLHGYHCFIQWDPLLLDAQRSSLPGAHQ